MSRGGRHGLVTTLLALAAASSLALPAASDAANRRVSISDYQWSDPVIELDLGEHVTWYWTGPDTMHSVTGEPPNATGLDSDPQTNQPMHQIGDSFELDFDKPGTYQFRCKLHSAVRGEVIVSDRSGDPEGEPDPVPQSNVDLTPPYLSNLRLARQTFGRRGTPLRFSIDSRARIEADFYRRRGDGRRRFAGWSKWKTPIGYGHVKFGARSRHFRPRPGRYVARIRAYDKVENETKAQRISFRIRGRH